MSSYLTQWRSKGGKWGRRSWGRINTFSAI